VVAGVVENDTDRRRSEEYDSQRVDSSKRWRIWSGDLTLIIAECGSQAKSRGDAGIWAHRPDRIKVAPGRSETSWAVNQRLQERWKAPETTGSTSEYVLTIGCFMVIIGKGTAA
jgi:hypothetical protein